MSCVDSCTWQSAPVEARTGVNDAQQSKADATLTSQTTNKSFPSVGGGGLTCCEADELRPGPAAPNSSGFLEDAAALAIVTRRGVGLERGGWIASAPA